jgi:HAD superfamily hydrolase (TIGR01459 family)
MQPITSLTDLLPLYDGFLIDLWGVVHDGSALYSGVKQSFAALNAANKRIVMLSNAPRRAKRSAEGLRALGIPKSSYHAMITSGEIAFAHISTHYAGKRFYFQGDEGNDDADILQGIPATRVMTLADAEVVLTIGHHYPFQPLSELYGELQEMRMLNLPMVCANPDREVVKMDGTVYPCAGEIAEHYAHIGGDVTFIGKPYATVYDAAVEALGLNARARILAIGDNPLTDIRGGRSYGIDTLLITGGVLRGCTTHAEMLARLEETGDIPTYCCTRFGIG